jgi:hypothetical protein
LSLPLKPSLFSFYYFEYRKDNWSKLVELVDAETTVKNHMKFEILADSSGDTIAIWINKDDLTCWALEKCKKIILQSSHNYSGMLKLTDPLHIWKNQPF